MKKMFLLPIILTLIFSCEYDDDDYAAKVYDKCTSGEIHASEDRMNEELLAHSLWKEDITAYVAANFAGYYVVDMLEYEYDGSIYYLTTTNSSKKILFDGQMEYVCAENGF